MKSSPFVLAAFALLIGHGASACDQSAFCGRVSCNRPVHIAQRHDAGETRFAIDTENGKAVLLLTDQVVALQLSDRVMHRVDRKMRYAENDGDNGLEQVIKTAVLTSVRSVLNHSLEVDIRDIAQADYRDGELILTARNGRRIFGHSDIDDRNVMRTFSESDGRAFVRVLRERMARER
jgi:hypothetical protein